MLLYPDVAEPRAIAAERRLWCALQDRRFRGLAFRRQLHIAAVDAGPGIIAPRTEPHVAVVDFACDDAPVVIELDGGQHDLKRPRERLPHGVLERRGYRVLRFHVDDVNHHFRAILAVIAAACDRGRGPPRRPSPPRVRAPGSVPRGSPVERGFLSTRPRVM